MEKKNNKFIMWLAIVSAIIVLFLLLRKNPKLAQVIQNASPFALPQVLFPETKPLDIDVNIDGYTPHDFPLPSIIDSDGGNRGVSCNFCLQSRVQIAPPSPPVKIQPVVPPPPQTKSWNLGTRIAGPNGTPHFDVVGNYLGKW